MATPAPESLAAVRSSGTPPGPMASPAASSDSLGDLMDDWENVPAAQVPDASDAWTSPPIPAGLSRRSGRQRTLITALMTLGCVILMAVLFFGAADYVMDELSLGSPSREQTPPAAQRDWDSNDRVRIPGHSDSPSNRYPWGTVRCEAGRFTVSLPTVGRSQSTERNFAVIEAIMDSKQCCSVSYYNVTRNDLDMAGGLEKHIDMFAERGNEVGTPVYLSNITLGRHVGRDFAHDFSPKLPFGTTTRMYMRVYHVDGTIIAMSWKGPICEENERDARYFFDSFRPL